MHEENDIESWGYCSVCLSPKIKFDDTVDSYYCADCGCTTLCESSFEEWEEKYKKRYKKAYLKIKKDITKSPIFKMTVTELMFKLSNYSNWKDVIKDIYGIVPVGLSKTDSIIVFFDKLIKDNKINDLKENLYKRKIV